MSVAIGLSVLLPLPSQILRQRCPAATTPAMALTGVVCERRWWSGGRAAAAGVRTAPAGGCRCGCGDRGGAVLHDEGVTIGIAAGLNAGGADRISRLLLRNDCDGKGRQPRQYRGARFFSWFSSPGTIRHLTASRRRILPAIVPGLVPVLRLVLRLVLLLFLRVLVLLLLLLRFFLLLFLVSCRRPSFLSARGRSAGRSASLTLSRTLVD